MSQFQEHHMSEHPLIKYIKSSGTITKILAGIAIVMFFIAHIVMKIYSINEVNAIILLGGQFRDFIVAGYEYWRFITSGFLHVDAIHLLSNVYSLIILGTLMEKMYSTKQYLALFFGATLMGSMFSFVFGKPEVSLGMSGALFGFLGAYTAFVFETKAIQHPPVRNQLLLILVLNLGISIGVSSIDMFAHIGGFVTGLLFALATNRRPDWYSMRKQSMIALFLLFVFMIVLVLQVRTLDNVYWGNIMVVTDIYQQWGLTDYVQWLILQLLKL